MRQVIESLSQRLAADFGTGFDRRNLCGTCGVFTWRIQFSTHCVENCPGPITGKRTNS